MNVDLTRGKRQRNVTQHADTVARGNLQTGGELIDMTGIGRHILIPPGTDPAVGFFLDMDIHAVAAMDGNTIAAGDKADDLIARNRRTAAGKLDQTVINAFDNNAVAGFILAALLLLVLRMRGTLGLLALAAQLADIVLNLIDDLGQHNAAVADGRVQLIDRVERELVERVLLHLFVLIEAVIQQVGTQLAVEILLAVDDIFLAAFLLEPLLDLVARLGGLDDLHPVTARTVCLLGGQDLDNIAVFQLAVDRCDTAVQLAAGHAVADCRVNRIRKVDRRCTCRHVDHIALGRKDEYLVREQVNLDVFDKVLGLGVLLGFKQLANPRERFLVALLVQTLLVLPVRRYTVFRHFMHLYGTNLHLKRDACSADDRRMQRLIAIRLRRGDIVLEAARNRLVQVVNVAEHVVAVRHGIDNDAHGADIINLVDGLVLGIHFAVDRVNMLDAGRNRVVDVRFLQLGADAVLNALQEFLVLLTLGL